MDCLSVGLRSVVGTYIESHNGINPLSGACLCVPFVFVF